MNPGQLISALHQLLSAHSSVPILLHHQDLTGSIGQSAQALRLIIDHIQPLESYAIADQVPHVRYQLSYRLVSASSLDVLNIDLSHILSLGHSSKGITFKQQGKSTSYELQGQAMISCANTPRRIRYVQIVLNQQSSFSLELEDDDPPQASDQPMSRRRGT